MSLFEAANALLDRMLDGTQPDRKEWVCTTISMRHQSPQLIALLKSYVPSVMQTIGQSFGLNAVSCPWMIHDPGEQNSPYEIGIGCSVSDLVHCTSLENDGALKFGELLDFAVALLLAQVTCINSNNLTWVINTKFVSGKIQKWTNENTHRTECTYGATPEIVMQELANHINISPSDLEKRFSTNLNNPDVQTKLQAFNNSLA
eukprot:TRINITY_DN67314_c5_g1_i17.p1 TRINITY_DN67314_c5_g1~~TRINITY_DN67314_c5_g1_i17.p1  ORF type:complete len:234 (+),score=14.64 TRINITY_DN67314_c5_g1_i17:96-704(+)